MPAFEAAEYRERQAKTKARMAAEGVDVLLASDPANMCYLSGYDGWSFYVPPAARSSRSTPTSRCGSAAAWTRAPPR